MSRIVVALGGNMLSDASNKKETFEDQLNRIEYSAKVLVDMIIKGHEVVVTHGNGPQVGSLLLRMQSDIPGATKLPLYILGALTQGQIGVLLQHALINEITKKGVSQGEENGIKKKKYVYVVPTSVIVDVNDPGFENPTKPVGPSYTEEEFAKLDKGDYQYTNTPKGYRRVVASPRPINTLENEMISDILENGNLVIAVGGGGSPTVRTEDGGYQLVDAVIDKDLASAMLAKKVNADMLVILTDVDGVYADFGTENQRLISKMGMEEAKKLLKDPAWGKGNMGPKVNACVEFMDKGKAIITSPNKLMDALEGNAGTTF